jgi:hypothetical protein
MTELEELTVLWGTSGSIDWAAEPAEPKSVRQSSLRDQERLQQGLGACFSPGRAAELLPGTDAANLRWLRQQGLVRTLPTGKEIVVWQEVIDHLTSKPQPQPKPTRRGSKSMPRFGL